MAEGLEAAIKKYSEQLAQDPKARVFVPLADLYRQSGRLDEAIAVAQEGLKQHPTYVAGKMALARAYFENGDIDLAYQLLEGVLGTSPDNILANRIFSEIAIQKSEWDLAKTALQRILSIEPSDKRSNEQLKTIESKRHTAPESKPQPELEATPVAPPMPAPEPMETKPVQDNVRTATLAELYRKQGHFKEALEVYRELSARDPSNESIADQIRELEDQLKPKIPIAAMAAAGSNRRGMLETLLKRISERRRAL